MMVLFQILKHIDNVAYQLTLPPTSNIHDVFHVSLLKPFKGPPPSTMPTLSNLYDGHVVHKPQQVHNAHLNFLKELFHFIGTKLAFSSSYHPQSNGQTKVVIHTIEMNLRCFVGDKLKS